MRSMTGYGRGQSNNNGTQFSVELNSVNRKQSDITVALPRELSELEPRVRDVVNATISRGRLTVTVSYHSHSSKTQQAAINKELAHVFYSAMRELQAELGASGEINIETVLRAPGVVCTPSEEIAPEEAWPQIEIALKEALKELVTMRELEGKNLAHDLIHRMKTVRDVLHEIRALAPNVVTKYRQNLQERLQKAGLELPIDDDRLAKEIVFFADKADISEELTRLESHFAQFAHHLRRNEPVGRTLDFMTQEIAREFNTLGSKANDVEISQRVVLCKAEMEKIREQIQNIE